jgi:hypothetical protein
MDRRSFLVGGLTSAAALADSGPSFGVRPFSGSAVSLQAVPVQGMLAISTTLGTGRPHLFEVNSAASGQMHIRGELVEALGLRSMGEQAAGPRYRLPIVRMGAAEFRDVAAIAHGPDWSIPSTLSGLVGLDLFWPYSLMLDFAHARVGLSHGRLPPSNRGSFAYEGRIPLVPVAIGNLEFRARIDTGQIWAPLLVPGWIAARIGFSRAPRPIGQAGETMILAGESRSPIRIGAATLPARLVAFPLPQPFSSLGVQAMRNSIVIIDQVGGRVALRQP